MSPPVVKEIITDVEHWDADGDTLRARRRGGEHVAFPMVKPGGLYTLIGYQHDRAALERMGLLVRDEGTVAADYDGEIQRRPGARGRERVWPGYFAIGAILDAPENPNATVIPGMLHHLHDMTFGAIVAARSGRAGSRTTPTVDRPSGC